jgi:fatty-acyl-CoA synthase
MAEHGASALVVVPVMLRRMVDLGEEKIRERDLSNLRIIFISGSALGADLAERALELFGPVVYNLYGSTEVAYATIATPEDLEQEPGTAGKIVRGSVVKLFDDDGNELKGADETGRIFVGNFSQFEGYTGGGNKDMIQGLMASGDVGHFDKEGRLFIDGRDDEMIVSGGENVFPAEVEDLLARHDKIEEAAAVGVDDEKFGQRLKVFVVLREGADLSEDDVKKYVKDNLANYKVPREVEFIDELPRNPTGKVLKKDLLEGSDDSDSDSDSGSSQDGERETETAK